MVARVDWARLRAVYETRRRRMLFERIAAPAHAAPPPDAAPADVRTRIVAAAAPEREALLQTYVADVVAGVLDLDRAPSALDPSTGFFDLGMDSLTSMDLRGRLERDLQVTLPSTLAFDYPNVRRLAAYLLELVAPATSRSLDGMSDADVEALLLKQLDVTP
jgi:acyl carrier protein